MSPISRQAGGGLSVPFLVDPDHRDIDGHIEQRRFFWLDLQGPTDEQLHRLAQRFGLHPLTFEDAREFGQRPKFEDYEGYVFMVAFGVDPGTSSGGPLLREVHVIISGDYVIADPTEDVLRRIFSLKRDLIAMRRVVSPERDMFARDAERISDIHGLEADDRLYYRDLYDSLIRISELVDSYRDLLSGATDMYLSTVANRQGEVNKTLTMIATVFLPLTFLTGFFGQNFSFLTNRLLDTEWSFIVFGVGLLLVSIIVFLIYFRRKRWM